MLRQEVCLSASALHLTRFRLQVLLLVRFSLICLTVLDIHSMVAGAEEFIRRSWIVFLLLWAFVLCCVHGGLAFIFLVGL